MSPNDTEALLRDIFDTEHRKMGCWRKAIPDNAKTFLENVESRMAQGEKAVGTKLARILRDHFDFPISSQQVNRHYRGDCTCRR